MSDPRNMTDEGVDDDDNDEVAGTDDRDGLIVITKDHAKWLLPVLEEIKAPPKGLGPMFYHGLSYENDLAHFTQAQDLLELLNDQLAGEDDGSDKG
jgi:hypothetical protein